MIVFAVRREHAHADPFVFSLDNVGLISLILHKLLVRLEGRFGFRDVLVKALGRYPCPPRAVDGATCVPGFMAEVLFLHHLIAVGTRYFRKCSVRFEKRATEGISFGVDEIDESLLDGRNVLGKTGDDECE